MSAVMHSKGWRLQSRVQTAYKLYSNRGQKGFCHLFFVDAQKPTLRDNVGKGKGHNEEEKALDLYH